MIIHDYSQYMENIKSSKPPTSKDFFDQPDWEDLDRNGSDLISEDGVHPSYGEPSKKNHIYLGGQDISI